MDLIKDFRRPDAARHIARDIHELIGDRRFNIMEVCGGQTHTIYKYRLREMLPGTLRLISGPGCPVCVTPIRYIDKAVRLSLEEQVTLFTFGDLMRVPGTRFSLEHARAAGAAVQAVYSPFQAVEYAREHPQTPCVFLGIGFETTMPSIGLCIQQAAGLQLNNFSVLLSGKRVPPVLSALLSSGTTGLHGFITPGHVTAVIGMQAYDRLCATYRVPMVVGGFEPLDLLLALRALAGLLADGRCENVNAYARAVKSTGNLKAQEIIDRLFVPADDELRGFGLVPQGGFRIHQDYRQFDADYRFSVEVESREPPGCICGEILSGTKEPADCGLFKKACTPDSPVGSCMVSAEGTCNAAYMYE